MQTKGLTKQITWMGIPLYEKRIFGDIESRYIFGIRFSWKVMDIAEYRRYFFGICYRRKRRRLKWRVKPARPASEQYIKLLKQEAKECLIVFGLAIGDYMLFRNFLKNLKESSKYKNYRLVLACDERLKETAECLDSDYLDEIISFGEHVSYTGEPNLRQAERIRRQLHSNGMKSYYDTILVPIMVLPHKSALPVYHHIISSVYARERISPGFVEARYSGNQFLQFTRIIPFCEDPWCRFRMDIYREYIEAVIGEKIRLQHPVINLQKIETLPPADTEPYIVCQPFCSSETAKIKSWHFNNWIDLIKQLAHARKERISLLCAPKEMEEAEEMKQILRADGIEIEVVSNLSIKQILSFLKGASAYVGLDSGIFHIAGAIGIPTVCISSGRSFLPFLIGYIDKRKENVSIVFPPGWEKWRRENAQRILETGYEGVRFINATRVDDVLNAVCTKMA